LAGRWQARLYVFSFDQYRARPELRYIKQGRFKKMGENISRFSPWSEKIRHHGEKSPLEAGVIGDW